MLGGGRWKSLDWSCCALGQGRVPLTHSTGSSQTAFWPWTWKTFRENVITLNEQLFSTNFTLAMFTLMPSLAPSWRYGMIEWFHRSINHGLNSATDTGHDKKKQGPNGDKNATLRKTTPTEPVTSWYRHVSHLWESLKCYTSPGKCGDGTKAEVPSQVSAGEPGSLPDPAPSLGGLPPLYDAGTSAGTRLLVPHCWRTSTSCCNSVQTFFRLMHLSCLKNITTIRRKKTLIVWHRRRVLFSSYDQKRSQSKRLALLYLKLRCSPWLDVILTGWLVVPTM